MHDEIRGLYCQTFCFCNWNGDGRKLICLPTPFLPVPRNSETELLIFVKYTISREPFVTFVKPGFVMDESALLFTHVRVHSRTPCVSSVSVGFGNTVDASFGVPSVTISCVRMTSLSTRLLVRVKTITIMHYIMY